MNLKGNILQIKTKRENQHKDIEILVDQVAYVTHKKDGRYYQPFEFILNLDTPLLITGDQLARADNKHSEDGEYEFKVFDKVDEGYELNPNKQLSITLAYDYEVDETILTSVTYSEIVNNEEYKKLIGRKPGGKGLPKGKDKNTK